MKHPTLFILAALAAGIPGKSTDAATDAVDALKARMPMPAMVAAPAAVTTWQLRAGSTLRLSLVDWARIAGYKVVWEAQHGFDIEADATLRGDFITAVTSLFKAYESAEPALYVDVYPDQKLLVVTSAKRDGAP